MTTIAIADERPDLLALLSDHWRAGVASLLIAALFAVTLVGIVRRDPSSDAAFYAEAAQTPAVREELRRAALATSATELRQVSAQDAVAINEAIPTASGANPAARPFLMSGAGDAERLRALDCLTAAIYYEAANESTDGQRGVAQVVLNRVRHPAYPATVCGVVFEGARRSTGCQFSFSCDGSLRRTPMPAVWQRARSVAEAALNGFVYAPAGWATHYHANYVVPYWASSLVKTVTVGAHIFYRWRGGWGRPPAFLNRYRGAEPAIAWRGGFGQPTPQERALAGAAAGDRDAMAAAAAQEAAGQAGSVDSFQRSVLRRYEPMRRDTATEIAREQVRSSPPMSNSQRWALTGDDYRAAAPQQRPLGRWAAPSADENPPPPAIVSPPAPGGQTPSPLN